MTFGLGFALKSAMLRNLKSRDRSDHHHSLLNSSNWPNMVTQLLLLKPLAYIV